MNIKYGIRKCILISCIYFTQLLNSATWNNYFKMHLKIHKSANS